MMYKIYLNIFKNIWEFKFNDINIIYTVVLFVNITEMLEETGISSDYQQKLEYYKEKVDELEGQREGWLAKFDECNSKLQKKQDKQKILRKSKDLIEDQKKDIIHHEIAEIDEQLSSLNMDRQNQTIEFEEAEQLVKMRQLVKSNPIILQKQLPCLNTLLGSQLIQNDLNIHSSTIGNNKSKKTSNSLNLSKGIKSKPQKKQSSFQTNSLDNLLKLRIVENKKLNQQQMQLLEHQKQLLKQSIIKLRTQQQDKVKKQRNVTEQFRKKYKQLEKKHKDLAQVYFEFRRNHKKKYQNSVNENAELKNKYAIFEGKIDNQMRIYEKQNKAKQLLIFRKSEDFQEDYKAKMRAKQRNLQALKENYEKMQEICIEKVRKLQATLDRAQYQLQDSQERRKFIVEQLRQQLRNLQKKISEQVIEKARLDIRLKKKLQQQKVEQQQKKAKEEAAERLLQRDSLIKSAYKKTRAPSGKKRRQQTNKRPNRNNAEEESQDDSLDMSDLQKIQKQINHLQNKIVAQDEPK